MKKVKKSLLILAISYVVYMLVGGVFTYIRSPKVSEDFEKKWMLESFYGTEEGVDRAELLESPKSAFVRRMEIIRGAKDSIDLVYHAIDDGVTSRCILNELFLAADRGVHVRILLDGKMMGLDGELKAVRYALQNYPNIEFRLYNPLNLLTPWKWNSVLHDKFIIVDQKFLLLGGRNIGDRYFDPPTYDDPVTNDRDVLIYHIQYESGVEGSVIESALSYMELLWYFEDTKDCSYLMTPIREKKAVSIRETLKEDAETFEATYPDYFVLEESFEEASVPTNRVSLIHNPINTYKKEPWIWYQMYRFAIEGKEVLIQSPYATANSYTLSIFQEIAEKADNFVYLTNSMASSPNLPAFSAYASTRDKFLETGVTIYEYQSENSIHAKSFLMDGHIAMVGSLNLDDRSIYLDTETMLVIDSEPFYEKIAAEVQKILDQSAKVGEDNTYVEDGSVEILEVSFVKRALMFFVSIFSRLFRFLI